METLRSPSFHFVHLDHHRCEVPTFYNPNYVLHRKKRFSVCRSHQNSFISLKLSEKLCQKLNDAKWCVFDVSLVNSEIKELIDNGLFEDAIRAYLNFLECGFPVEEFRFFPCLLKAFGGLCDVDKGKQIHGSLLKLGSLEDIYVRNSILGMYWKCAAVGHAVRIFERMEEKDLVSWNTMISGYCQTGDFVNSLKMFNRMIKECGSVNVNRVACLSALSSCASIELLTYGREIHGLLEKSGLDFDERLISMLIDMYMKCGDVKNGELFFKRIVDTELVRGNTVVWNVMISGYISNKCPPLALELFIDMLELGMNPDSATFIATLALCSQLLDLEVGKQLHGVLLRFGLEYDIRVQTSLMEMYFKCGDAETGMEIFRRSKNDNLVTWGSVISNCVQSGYPNEALQFFHDFMFHYGFPDSVILLTSLRACSTLAFRPRGMEIHGLAIKMGFNSDVFIGGALVDLYGKYGDMDSAQEVFSRLSTRDLVSWNALISGFAQNECPNEALKAFHQMQSEKIKPNGVTMACILSVCSHLSIMAFCKKVHCYILRHGFELNVLVNNSLVSSYAKCGDINSSWTVFESMPSRNEISWNSIILGFGMHGRTDDMLATFENMKEAGMTPDHATFTALLSACSHSGKVEMGWKYFDSMVQDYNLQPHVEQYTCMVDLLGRAGHLDQAYNLIMTMPCFPDDRIWGSLLASCKNHGDAKLAKAVANHIFELNPTSIGYRVLLSNLYEDSGKWDEVARVRSEIKNIRLKKQPGCSWIEVDNNIHLFIASDCLHEHCQNIYAAIESLTLAMKSVGYVPHLQSASAGPDEVFLF